MHEKKGLPLPLGICICMLLAAVILLWSVYYYSSLYQTGSLLAVRNADVRNLKTMLVQHLMVSLPELMIMSVVFWLRAKLPTQELALTFPAKRHKICLMMVVTLFCFVFVMGWVRHRWHTTALLYAPIYYLFFIAFLEEFLFHGVMPMLLHGYPVYLRYLLPNFLFSLMHITMPIVTDTFTLQTLFSYSVGGFIIPGCIFQLTKEKSGSLWIPVFIHAAMDMCIILF